MTNGGGEVIFSQTSPTSSFISNFRVSKMMLMLAG
jgi:hypothetical protein